MTTVLSSLHLRHYFTPSAQGAWWSGGYTWADSALHLSVAQFLSENGRIVFDFGLLYGEKITYPLIVDAFSGFLIHAGLSERVAFVFPNILYSILIVGAVLLFFQKFLKSAAVRIAAMVSVLVFGSFGGVVLWLKSVQGKVPAGLDISNAQDYGLYAASFLTSHLLPQRTILLGFSVALLCMWLTLEYLEKRQGWQVWGACVLFGLLPFIHVQSFLVVAAFLVIALFRMKQGYARIVLPALAAVTLFVPQILWQLQAKTNSYFVPRMWWMAEAGQSAIGFWWVQWGPLLILICATWFLALRKKDSAILHILLVASGIFLASNIYLFHPNPWDNMKFLVYAQLFFILGAFWSVEQLPKKYVVGVAVGVALILSATGLHTLHREFMQKYEFLSADDVAFGRAVERATNSGDVIVTSSRHNHPVPLLAGRQIVLGFQGWLFSYGIEYKDQADAVSKIFQATAEFERSLQEYSVDYVAIANSEKAEYQFNSLFYESIPVAVQTEQWTLYDMRGL